MSTHPLRWQSPQPLWTRLPTTGDAVAPAQAQPAILRFSHRTISWSSCSARWSATRRGSMRWSRATRPGARRCPKRRTWSARTPVPRLAASAARTTAAAAAPIAIAPPPADERPLQALPARAPAALSGRGEPGLRRAWPARAGDHAGWCRGGVRGGASPAACRERGAGRRHAARVRLREGRGRCALAALRCERCGQRATHPRRGSPAAVPAVVPRRRCTSARAVGGHGAGRASRGVPGQSRRSCGRGRFSRPASAASSNRRWCRRRRCRRWRGWRSSSPTSQSRGRCWCVRPSSSRSVPVRARISADESEPAGDAQARIHDFNLQQQAASWLVLLDCADLIATHMTDLWAAIDGNGAGYAALSQARRDLYDWLGTATMGAGLDAALIDPKPRAATLRAALKSIRAPGGARKTRSQHRDLCRWREQHPASGRLAAVPVLPRGREPHHAADRPVRGAGQRARRERRTFARSGRRPTCPDRTRR